MSRRAFVSIALLAAAGLVLNSAWRLSDSRRYQLLGELVTRVETSDSLVALTFDDGPIEPHTDSVLALLAEKGVPATFFFVGEALERAPELARRVLDAGHEIGNHSFTHSRMVLKSPGFVRDEVERTDAAIRRIGYEGPIGFRPPYGTRLLVLPWYLARSDRATILWDVEPDSWEATAEGMVTHVLERVRPGSIILIHVETPVRSENRKALPVMIDALRKRGYRFTTVSDLRRASGGAGR